MRMISSLLVANRGEIAVRIIRACQELGIKTILAASEADRESMPALIADRVVCIGPPKATESYLKVGTIVMAASERGLKPSIPVTGFLPKNRNCPKLAADYANYFCWPESRTNPPDGGQDLGAANRPKTWDSGNSRVRNGFKTADEIFPPAEKIGYPLLLKAAGEGAGEA